MCGGEMCRLVSCIQKIPYYSTSVNGKGVESRRPGKENPMLIINGTVHTMDGLTIPGGYVAIRGDKIAQVGPMEECPKDWEGRVFDAHGGHIAPGFIDAHCHLGMFGDGVGIEGTTAMRPPTPVPPPPGGGRGESPGPLLPGAREAGVTTVLTGPAPPIPSAASLPP